MQLPDAANHNELRFTTGPSRAKLVLALLGMVVFFAASVFIALMGNINGWLSAAFWACVFPFGIKSLRRGSRILRLNPEGFVVEGGKAPPIRWSEVERFFVIIAGKPNEESASGLALSATVLLMSGGGVRGGGKSVAFNFVPGYAQHQKSRRAARELFGYECLLPEVRGHKPENIAALMNEWKNVHS